MDDLFVVERFSQYQEADLHPCFGHLWHLIGTILTPSNTVVLWEFHHAERDHSSLIVQATCIFVDLVSSHSWAPLDTLRDTAWVWGAGVTFTDYLVFKQIVCLHPQHSQICSRCGLNSCLSGLRTSESHLCFFQFCWHLKALTFNNHCGTLQSNGVKKQWNAPSELWTSLYPV